ncbi:hypothetical protein NFI96_013855 [Prochilodus magdalenae]|nr:hypothetical protein NFI96_013855 [Prochilodus magdalenae]
MILGPAMTMRVSMDEGRHWDRFSFSSTPLFVDGVLMEQDTQNYIITFFGHFNYLSDWQLVKIDYSALLRRKCTEGDYQTWHLHSKGEVCVMGQRQVFMKRKPGVQCAVGPNSPKVISAESCICTFYDFECDYGYERQVSGRCVPAFWYDMNASAHTCNQGQAYLKSAGYRRVHSNNCDEGLKETLSPRQQQCEETPPSGLQLQTSNTLLTANLGTNVTFRVTLQHGDSVSTSLHLDFGDGISVSYSNFSRLGNGVKHIYRTAGIFRATAHAQNSQGSDFASLYLHITSPVERITLSAPLVAIKGRQTNLTAVVWPSQPVTAAFYWWFSNSTEPLITLEGSVSHTFVQEGRHMVVVQVSAGSSVLQDSETITVTDFFRSLLLSFSPNLEEHNPSVSEWRQDVGRVVTATLSQMLEVFINALNQNLIQFDLKPDTRITVSVTQLTLAPLVDSSALPSGSAALMLVSLAFVGLAVFFIYKFKRKIPWIHVQTEDTQEKEPEMISTVEPGQNTTHTSYTPRNTAHTPYTPRNSTHIPFTTRFNTHTPLPSCPGAHSQALPTRTARDMMEELETPNGGKNNRTQTHALSVL